MQYPLISEYIEAIQFAEDNFATLTNLRSVLDETGAPVMSSGNFAVVFKMEDIQTGKLYAVKCFLRDQQGRAEAYSEICNYFKTKKSEYLVQIEYLQNELFVDTSQTDRTEFPVLKMDWVDGCGIEDYIYQNLENTECLNSLHINFEKFILWLLPSHMAHGDLKPDNIIITPKGEIYLIDYDGVFVPTMWGQEARELGTPQFQYQGRTISDFNEFIDDFAGIYLALILKIITIDNKPLNFYTSMNKETLIVYASRFINDIYVSKLLSAFLFVNSIGFVERETLHNVFYNEQKRNRKLELELLYETLRGNTQAMIQLGNTYSRGKFTPSNTLKALECFYTAKLMGNVNAECGICRHFYHVQSDYYGIKNYCNNPIHIVMREKSIDFSLCREAEENWHKDKVRAIDFFKKAAQFDFAPAINWLSILDKTNKISFLRQAASLGYASANKQLADYYKKGENVPQNSTECLKYLKYAANLGDDVAQYELGLAYSNGYYNCQINLSNAVQLFLKSAKQGNENAISQLFVCYYEGKGVSQNYKQAFSLLNQYRFSSNPYILRMLGYCYEYGIGISINYASAFKYYLKAIHDSWFGDSWSEIQLEYLCKMHNIKDETEVELSEIGAIGECNTGTYSSDGQRFLCYWGTYGEEYSVTEGTKVLCNESFNDMYSECDGHYLKKLILPESLERIGNNVFCASISEVECKSEHFTIKDDFLLSEDEKILYRYFGTDDILNIPSTIIYIKGGAFSEKQIKQIHIPKSVQYIGDNPFAGIYTSDFNGFKTNELCIKNESEYFKIIDGVMYDVKGKRLICVFKTESVIHIAKWTKVIGKNAFWESNTEIIDFTESQIEQIDETAFYQCDKLKGIFILQEAVCKYKKILPTYVHDKIVLR